MSCPSRKVVNALTAAKTSFRGASIAIPSTLGKRSVSTRTPITMMPEGPEVRTLVDQVQGGVGMRLCDIQFLSGRYVRHGKPDGYSNFSETMTPWVSDDTKKIDLIREWNAKGKFIYIVLDNGNNEALTEKDDDFQRSIWITLGMSGRFVSESVHSQNSAYARWYLELLDQETNKKRKIYYHDARNFGTLKFSLSANALADKLNKLGPDILDSATTENVFLEIVEKQKPEMNICKFLMNQSKLSGVGNYILSEGLYRAAIDPFASLSELNNDQQRRLFQELQSIALESYNAQGLSRKGGTFRDVEGKRGRFEFELQCYGRDVCASGKRVVKETDGPHGRTIWYVEDQLFLPRIMRFGSMPSATTEEDVDDNDITDETVHEVEGNDPSIDQCDAVERLVTGITDPGWKEALSDAVQSETFKHLVTKIEKERSKGVVIYPPEKDMFSALNLCPLDKVKVVIVGQVSRALVPQYFPCPSAV